MSNDKYPLEKKLYSNKIKDLKENCSICRDDSFMYSTGYLYKSNYSKHWVLEFKCSFNEEISKIWDIKYENLIKEVLKDNGIEE